MKVRSNIYPFNREILKEERKKKKLTQTQLGDVIGVRSISGFECGDKIPSQEAEEKLEKYFGVEEKFFRKPIKQETEDKNFTPLTGGTKVNLPNNEKGEVIKYNSRLWDSNYLVKITENTLSDLGEEMEFLQNQVTKSE